MEKGQGEVGDTDRWTERMGNLERSIPSEGDIDGPRRREGLACSQYRLSE